MATHDYVIDNQSASAFRSDLNGALQAIVTQNSNATAPATTYANMIWYDTATNQLKKRNEANSAWIVLGTVNEGTGTFTPSGERALASQVQAEAGTDNTTVMTPLRSAQAIDAQVNATKVGLATAELAYGAVGTYAFLRYYGSPLAVGGTTVAGSTLLGGSTYGGFTAIVNDNTNTNIGISAGGSALTGTWRCMGRAAAAGANVNNLTAFLRIS